MPVMSYFAVNYWCSHRCGTVASVGTLQRGEVEGGRKTTFGWPEVKGIWFFGLVILFYLFILWQSLEITFLSCFAWCFSEHGSKRKPEMESTYSLTW